jgi:hypothetical protein
MAGNIMQMSVVTAAIVSFSRSVARTAALKFGSAHSLQDRVPKGRFRRPWREQRGVKLEPAKGSVGSADPARTWLTVDTQPLHLRDQRRSRQAQSHGRAIPAAEHSSGFLKSLEDVPALQFYHRHGRGRLHLGQLGQ